jgi:hypothetical protein
VPEQLGFPGAQRVVDRCDTIGQGAAEAHGVYGTQRLAERLEFLLVFSALTRALIVAAFIAVYVQASAAFTPYYGRVIARLN